MHSREDIATPGFPIAPARADGGAGMPPVRRDTGSRCHEIAAARGAEAVPEIGTHGARFAMAVRVRCGPP